MTATPVPAASPAPLSEEFRAAFRRHAAGVALVVAPGPDGPVGLTVSSLASVSAAPPLLSFSVGRGRSAAAAVVGARRLDVHLLGADQRAVAEAFATPGAPRFLAAQGWRPAHRPGELPVLEGAPARLAVAPVQVVPAGESWLVVAELVAAHLAADPAAPLVHHDRAYATLRSLPHPTAACA